MASRLELQSELESILGSRNVYFQPPSSVRMKYPCICYNLSNIDTTYANNKSYTLKTRYDLLIIDQDPDSVISTEIMKHFMMCSFDRCYTADGLNHTSLTLYY